MSGRELRSLTVCTCLQLAGHSILNCIYVLSMSLVDKIHSSLKWKRIKWIMRFKDTDIDKIHECIKCMNVPFNGDTKKTEIRKNNNLGRF